jgi:hypothetical protein
MEKDMVCRACSTQERDFKWILHFFLEIQRGRAHFRDLSIPGRIIIKLLF